ncbi:sulfurtransferase TusA family protein [Paracoccus subflavus]|uniref:Sulfurtransferase TusA family protein n=1 Tax=Paracoccus subflavus TaxID=2528244 RepID=A0A4Q9G544_9RHOB|nr:sulfurtransferase TusA family protein [Paracoccus subflavus]TBN42517.1 sulfurtransferase TusA family protein [Paracoccus subflavus]
MSRVVDARGLVCPLPVLRLRKALMAQPVGARVTLLATDAMAALDVPHFCAEAGHRLVVQRSADDDGVTEFIIERGPATPAQQG